MQLQIDLHALLHDSNSQTREFSTPHQGAYQRLLMQIEPAFLHCLLEFTHSNKSHAARVAGINISTLERKLNRYGIVVNKIISPCYSAKGESL